MHLPEPAIQAFVSRLTWALREYLLSARSIHARGGRKGGKACCARIYARGGRILRRRHNGNGGAMRAKRYAKLRFAQFARARDAPRESSRSIPIAYTGLRQAGGTLGTTL